MLEHSVLLLHDWRHSDGWRRAITDAAGSPLGFVRFVGEPSGSWFSWFRQIRLEIYETADASLLLTLTRSWGMLRIWEVHDADDLHVGSVYTKTIATGEGECIGYFDSVNDRVLDPVNRPLVTYKAKEAGLLELSFADVLAPNPFLRMVLLSCVLTLDPAPNV